MAKLKVEIAEHGFSGEYESYYVTYRVSNLDSNILGKLKERLKDPVEIRGNDLYITIYFEEKFYPFRSKESQIKPEDYINREELEMTAYLLDLLED